MNLTILRIIDTAKKTLQDYFPSKLEDVQQLLQLKTGRAQWDPGTPSTGDVWPKVVFMEDMQPKIRIADMENVKSPVQESGSWCCGLMSENLKYLALAEGRLFTGGL